MTFDNNRFEELHKISKLELLTKAAIYGHPYREIVVDIDGIAKNIHLYIFLTRVHNRYEGYTKIRMITLFHPDYVEYEIATAIFDTTFDNVVNTLIMKIIKLYNDGYTIIRYAKGVVFW